MSDKDKVTQALDKIRRGDFDTSFVEHRGEGYFSIGDKENPTKEQGGQASMITLETIAEFTWGFGQEFFLETSDGNYIWSDPDYGGDNTIRPTRKTYKEWIGKGRYGRDKGKHTIGGYCGNDVKLQK